MKKLIMMSILAILPTNSVFAAQNSCGSPCDDVTSDQKRCVLNNFCHEKKLKQEIQALEEKKRLLEEELSKQKAKYDKLVFEIHHNLPEPIQPEPQKKNSVSVIVGTSATALKTESTTSTFKAETKPELDLGLMYQRDISKVRGSVSATINGSVMFGVGLMF